MRILAAWSSLSMCVLVFALSSCGGDHTTGPVTPPPPTAATVATTAVADADEPLPTGDTSAVEEPQGLVVLARIARPSETLATLSDWGKKGELSPDRILQSLMNGKLADLADLEQPIDVAAAVVPEGRAVAPRFVISFALRHGPGTYRALKSRFSILQHPNGVLALKPSGPPSGEGAPSGEDAKGDHEGHEGACSVAPAAGSASHRVVCSRDEDSVRDLLPFVTRTYPRTETKGVIVAEIRASALHEPARKMAPLFKSMAEATMSAKDRKEFKAALDMGITNAIDFVTDLRHIAASVEREGNGAQVSVELVFGGDRSPFTKMLTGAGKHSGALSDAVLRFPRQTKVLVATQAFEASSLKTTRDAILQVFEAGMKRREEKTSNVDAEDPMGHHGPSRKPEKDAAKVLLAMKDIFVSLTDPLMTGAPIMAAGGWPDGHSPKHASWLLAVHDVPVATWTTKIQRVIGQLVKAAPKSKGHVALVAAPTTLGLPRGSQVLKIKPDKTEDDDDKISEWIIAVVPESKTRTVFVGAPNVDAFHAAVDSYFGKDVSKQLASVSSFESLVKGSTSLLAYFDAALIKGQGGDPLVITQLIDAKGSESHMKFRMDVPEVWARTLLRQVLHGM